MSARFGIDLLTLLDAPLGSSSGLGSISIPPVVSAFVERLSVLSYDTSVADGWVVDTGLIQTGVFQTLGDDAEGWPLRIPGLFETGLPFRLLQSRQPVDAGDHIERAGDRWLLQIATQGLSVRLPFDAANFVAESVTRPAYLVKKPAGANKETRLAIDTGVLEISSDGDVLIRPNLSMSPDPYQGALIRFRVDPAQFFVYEETVGIRTGQVILDLSELVSPSVVERAGFGPAFRGVYLEELGVYFPPDTPFIVPKSITLRDALIGTGFAGEGVIELGANTEPPPRPTFIDHEGNEAAIGANNMVLLPLHVLGGVIDSRLRVVAVADATEPWGARRDQARWTMPDGSTERASRTTLLEVRPGDTLEYTYEPPSSEGTYEAPARQTFMFDVAGGIYPRGTTARIMLRVTTGATVTEYFDVTHVNAPISSFVPDPAAAGPDTTFTLVPVDEEGDPLAVTVDSTWLVDDRPVARSDDGSSNVNLARYVNQATAEALTDPTPAQEIEIERSTLRILLSAEGYRRAVIVDVLGDPRVRDVKPLVVHRRQTAGDFDDHWTVEEIGGPSPVMVRAPGDGQTYHFGSAVSLGRLRPLATPEPTIDQAEPTPDAPVQTLSADEVCSNYRPGYVYELLPTNPVIQVHREPPRIEQISFFFTTGRSGEADVVSIRVLEHTSATVSAQPGTPLTDAELAARLDGLQVAALEVVGRSSTRSTITNPTRREADNRRLGRERAQTAGAIMQRVLGSADVPPTVSLNEPRGEEDPTVSPNAGDATDIQNSQARLGNVLPHDSTPPDPLHNDFQRADVIVTSRPADGGARWVGPTDDVTVVGARRALLPCAPGDSPEPIRYELGDSALQRLRATVRWDRDPLPTKMELMAVVRTSDVVVDAGATHAISRSDITTDEDLWRFVLSLITDGETGLSRWTFSLEGVDDDGLFSVEMPPGLGTLLVFGPLFARMAVSEVEDGEETNIAGWVGLSVLGGLSGIAEATGIVDDVKLIANGVSVEVDTRNGPFDTFEAIYLKLDYSVEFRIREPTLLGIESDPAHPVRLRFRNVGLAYNHSTKNVQFLFDEEGEGDFSIEDAGTFRQTPEPGALGSLIQVVGARLGQGSIFIELDLRFVIDIGLLEITQTTIRLVFDDDGFSVELRGLGIKLEIPGTLVGEGSLVIRDNGFRAALALEIIPMKMVAAGSLDFADMGTYTAVGVGLLVQFPVGLPLGGTGLAIYGLLGAFGANMRRAVPTSGGIIENELAWLSTMLNPASRDAAFAPNQDSWTFGVGAIVGTLPDGGSSFHAKGALVLELPGPSVLFGIDVQFVQQRRGAEGGNDLTSAIRGLIGFTSEAFFIGIRVDLSLGEMLKVKIPIDALFPRVDTLAAYLRIGSDGSGGRGGDPVSVELELSDFVGAEAWLFFMIEEKGIVDLGRRYLSSSSAGLPEFNGFSIGFGMGISVFLGVRSIGTFIEIELLAIAGMGTSPIVIGGFIEARGTLSILWVSFSVSAMLDFLHRQPGPALPPGERDGSEITEPETTFSGRFCAEIDLFFFSIKACFEFHFGDGDPCRAPAPPPLVPGLGFVDRRGFELGRLALDDQTGLQIDEPTVWPDTTIAVNLLAEPDLDLDPASPVATSLTSTDHHPLRVGEFEYRFTLVDLRLEHDVGGDVWEAVADSFDASMWYPTGRPAFTDPVPTAPPTGHGAEVRSIGLLTWDPVAWARALVPGAHPGVEDGIREGADRLCERPRTTLRDCALFGNSTPTNPTGRWFARGIEGWADLLTTLDFDDPGPLAREIDDIEENLDVSFVPMAPLAFPFAVSAAGGTFDGGLRTAQFVRLLQTHLASASTMPTRATLVRPQFDGRLVLFASSNDFEFNSGGEVLLPGELGGEISQRDASVVVTDTDGRPHLVPGQLVGTVQLGEAHSPDDYAVWVFETSDSSLGDGTFVSWHVPAALGDVILVEACGSDSATRDEIAVRDRRASDAVDAINAVAAADPFEPSRFVLEADRRHRLLVSWAWTGRRVPDPAGTAEAERVDCDGETRGTTVTQQFTFRTAPDYVPPPGTADAGPPAEPNPDAADIDYTSFDVRDLRHYLKTVPRFDAPPMFTDDLIHIEYHVDHIVDLLGRYDRILELAVVRTDTRSAADPEPTRMQLAGVADFWEGALFAALAAQPCIDHPPPAHGGGELLAYDLEPNARYDLLVTGPTSGGGESLDRHLIDRVPFRTSRYAGPSALFREAGWAPASAPLSYLPTDLVVAADTSLSGAIALGSDVEFEAALAALGLDIEQSERPVTTVLWKPPIPTPEPTRPTLRDGLIGLGLLDRDRLNVKRLVELLIMRSKREPGIPIFPSRAWLPVRDARLPDVGRISDPRDRFPDRFRRDPGARYGLEWFHKLLVLNGLDDAGGDVVEALGKRMTLAFKDRRSGGLSHAVDTLRALVEDFLVRPPRPRPQGWRIAGVLIESLEPIVRPDEVDLDAISVSRGSLPLRSSNSAQSRLLFVGNAAVELVPGTDAAVVLQYRHRRIAGVDDDGQLVHADANISVEHRVGHRPQSIEWEV
jgi:hypothetical protein